MASVSDQGQREDQQIAELLRDEEFHYQSMILPGGVRTSGNDRSNTLDKILPPDLTGKTVLDIGCRYGFFSFEAARRGAKSVVGLDFDKDALSKARRIAALSKLNVEFREGDISRAPIAEKFDYVLCLNVLHHLRDPLGVLQNLIEITNERLILEMAGLWGRDRKKIFQRNSPATWTLHPVPFLQPILDRLPVIVLGSDKRMFEANFFFSAAAMRSLLVHRNRVFWKADVFPSPFKGRFLCVADKLRIGELLVVAGPSAAGKSRMIERLQRRELPNVEAIWGSGGQGPWEVTYPNHLSDLRDPSPERLAYHYDITRPYLRGPFNYSRDRALDLLDLARSVASLTVVSSPADLQARWFNREIAPKTYFGHYFGPKRSKKLHKALQDRRKVIEFYDRWLDFLAGRPGRHHLFSVRDGAEHIHPVDEWRTLRDSI